MNTQKKLIVVPILIQQKPVLKLVHNKAPQKIPVSCRYCELLEERQWLM